MATTIQGASGALQLRYKFYESASGHVDSTDEAKLLASEDGETVILELFADKNNMFSSVVPGTTSRYSISAAELEALIVQHGKRI